MNRSADVWNSAREPALEVYLLGLAELDACLHLQDRLAAEVALRNDGTGYLLVSEHLPAITIGREGSQAHLACSQEELVARQMSVRWVSRGGGCVVHVPGQLAAYPILPLDRRELGLAAFRSRLEQAVIDVCGEFRVPAQTDRDRAGVWCRGGQVAQIGVSVRSQVSGHGLFLNVNPRPDALRLVRVDGARPSSLAAERRSPTAMPAVRESLIRNLAERLGYGRFHLYTGHPLLRPVRKILAYA